jgi:hypothetical protein
MKTFIASQAPVLMRDLIKDNQIINVIILQIQIPQVEGKTK